MAETMPWQKKVSQETRVFLHGKLLSLWDRVRVTYKGPNFSSGVREGRITRLENERNGLPVIEVRDWDGTVVGRFDGTNSSQVEVIAHHLAKRK